MPASPQPLLRVTGVTHRFGLVTALFGVDLEIYPGDFLAIFGPNGAGKSTLLRIIASLIRPTRGNVEFLDGSGSRSRVGYVSHQSLLYPELSGRENLVFYGRLYSLPDPARRAQEMLDQVGLAPAGDLLVRGYSRGMKQRLTLARALLHEPPLLLLDEPYTGLDQHGARLLTSVLQSLRRQGRTVLLITHNLREGYELCTRLLIANRGELVFGAARQDLDYSELEYRYFEAVDDGAPSPC